MDGLRLDKLRVLVVDDNQHMRRLVVAVLQAFGIRELFESPDAEHAWAHLRTNNPDVIILDWQLTGMTGLEFAHLVRNSAHSPNIFVPIIMLTGHTHIDRVRQARDAGVNEFLAKPVSVQAILSRLMSVIENPRPFISNHTYFGPCRRRRSVTVYKGPERRIAELSAVD
jgi:two-component system, chemotaxis family, chemotaxis protein CheY